MTFRIQDAVSGLFWKVSGLNISLAEAGDEFTEDANGIVNVFCSGSYLYFMDDRPSSLKFTTDGHLTSDGYIFISASVAEMRPAISLTPTVWTKVGLEVPEPVVEVPEPDVEVPEPVVEDPEPVVEEPEVAEPELVSEEEDVPVARGAALIEEALNAQAAAAEDDKDIE